MGLDKSRKEKIQKKDGGMRAEKEDSMLDETINRNKRKLEEIKNEVGKKGRGERKKIVE